MALYMVLHTPRKSPEELSAMMTEVAMAEVAKANASGALPAKCIKTWNPMPHGRTDYSFCLYEADKLENVEACLEEMGVLEMFTADTMEVTEIDWAELARAVG